MHTLVKEGTLSSMSDIMNYISYSTKVSELANIYPIRRCKGCTVSQKQPMTAAMLLAIKSHLNLTDPVHATFWAVCLTGFFGLLRKANMLLKGVAKFNPLKHLRRSDIVFYRQAGPLSSTAGLKPSSLVNVSLLFHYLSS